MTVTVLDFILYCQHACMQALPKTLVQLVGGFRTQQQWISSNDKYNVCTAS